jgi:probable rRNA maturation factor
MINLPMIEVINKSNSSIMPTELQALCAFIFMRLGIPEYADLSLSIVCVDEMTKLNEKWMNSTGATDVLSFPMDELTLDTQTEKVVLPEELNTTNNIPDATTNHIEETGAAGNMPELSSVDSSEILLGDIVICPDYIVEKGPHNEPTIEKEILLLVAHGILHLLGCDHIEPDEHKVMFLLQKKLLQEFLAETKTK